jgi:hypothetical protein
MEGEDRGSSGSAGMYSIGRRRKITRMIEGSRVGEDFDKGT